MALPVGSALGHLPGLASSPLVTERNVPLQNDPLIYVPVTLLAALGFAAAAVMQQIEAAREDPGTSGGGPLLIRLLRRPLWVLGLVAYVVAYGLQVFAVSLGPVVVIQPLIAAQLVFALVLNTFFIGRRAAMREWLGAVAVTLGLAGFIVGTDPSPGRPEASLSAWWLATGLTFLAVLFCLFMGSRRQGSLRSALYGTAAGLCWGFMIILMKVVTHQLSEGSGWSEFGNLFESAAFYGLLVSAIWGFLLLQKAFQAGSLSHALVSYTVVEIVLAVLLGILLFGEKPHSTAASLSLTAVASVVMFVGIVMLGGARTEVQESSA